MIIKIIIFSKCLDIFDWIVSIMKNFMILNIKKYKTVNEYGREREIYRERKPRVGWNRNTVKNMETEYRNSIEVR